MREKKKRPIFPRSLIKSLSEDIKNLMENSEGQLLALEILDEIPYELRSHIIEGLSSFYFTEIAEFLYLVREEYGKELEVICNRGLEKFQMAGMEVAQPPSRKLSFYKAFVSRTRHSGQVTLDVAWKGIDGLLEVECFFLSFNSDGLNGFFVISEMPVKEYEADRRVLPDMVEISQDEACWLAKESYSFNIRFMTRPALGKFLYRKYLDHYSVFDIERETALLTRITRVLSPRELVNSFFHAYRNNDITYINSIISRKREPRLPFLHQLTDLFSPGSVLVEGQATEVRITRDCCTVRAYSIHVEEDELYRSDYSFHMVEKKDHWYISRVTREGIRSISENQEDNPFQDKVNCLVYEIIDLDEMLNLLEEIDDLREVGELPFGVHLRVIQPENDISMGVFFLTGVVADIVINGDELVVIAQEESSMKDIESLLSNNLMAVRPVAKYSVEIMTAYNYLSGQFLNFEDVLVDEKEELFFEDGLKFITARYLVKDQERVHNKLGLLKTVSYKFPDYEVYYEFGGNRRQDLVAEYVLGKNWVTVSAFGAKELGLIRDRFESGLRECLEFEGMEVKCEGIFELITNEVKKQYPMLESEIKQGYLNKWYSSNLKPLRGMSPQDAAKTSEGKLLLWRMFKEIKRKERKRQDLGVRNGIGLREYMLKVDMRKEKKS